MRLMANDSNRCTGDGDITISRASKESRLEADGIAVAGSVNRSLNCRVVPATVRPDGQRSRRGDRPYGAGKYDAGAYCVYTSTPQVRFRVSI